MQSDISESLEILEDLITQFTNERAYEQYCITNALNNAFGEKWIDFEEIILTKDEGMSKEEIQRKIEKRKQKNKETIQKLLN